MTKEEIKKEFELFHKEMQKEHSDRLSEVEELFKVWGKELEKEDFKDELGWKLSKNYFPVAFEKKCREKEREKVLLSIFRKLLKKEDVYKRIEEDIFTLDGTLFLEEEEKEALEIEDIYYNYEDEVEQKND